jgi:hypothetical protein
MNSILDFLHELWVRLTLKNPAFAATMQKVSGVLVGLIGALLIANSQASWGWDVKTWTLVGITLTVVQWLGILSTVLLTVIGTSQLSVEDRVKLDKKIGQKAPSAKRKRL